MSDSSNVTRNRPVPKSRSLGRPRPALAGVSFEELRLEIADSLVMTAKAKRDFSLHGRTAQKTGRRKASGHPLRGCDFITIRRFFRVQADCFRRHTLRKIKKVTASQNDSSAGHPKKSLRSRLRHLL